ncbi:MAG TPA: hypothetical protein VH137_02310 [Gemmatimonadales bacterium]|nr:hypothetical protein [Gemmatimonadales bacterium]
MGPKSRGVEPDADAAAAALDRLYAAPLDAFVPLRRDLVAVLRKTGDAAASRRVAAASKPSRTAWALNQVARLRPELLIAVLDARASALAAQKDGAADAVRATARRYREQISCAVQAAGEILVVAGVRDFTATQGRRIGATMQALAGQDDPEGRARLLGGQLVADVDVDDPFAGLAVGTTRGGGAAPAPPRDDLAPRRAARAAAEVAARERTDRREREKKAQELEKARDRVHQLEKSVSEARASARHAEVAATRAQAEAERARRAVDAWSDSWRTRGNRCERCRRKEEAQVKKGLLEEALR